jgi:hypothetical protein
MQEFLFILKGDGMDHLAPDELQEIFSSYRAWVAELGQQYLGGQRLVDEGALLKSQETIATDGPFLESKEIIAGFFMIMARDLQDAIEIAKRCPHLGLYEVEVRALVQPVNEMKSGEACRSTT